MPGNVFTNGHDLTHSLLRWSQRDPQVCLQQATASQCDYNYISHAIGIGVRYKTPVGPVRFDFGYNLNPPAFPGQKTLVKARPDCLRPPAREPFQRFLQHWADFLMVRKAVFTFVGTRGTSRR